ncbi:hypothetical protein AK812_SmicGene41325 [Symbiodinium microadriaticum]|uniref:Uncharacterized protein n=1 Tax=Symbiodinium microadriaticum TaxID=2951 RepID=A0A1Q9C6C1_SYMMI|nr:hypothetical protein AK812_SmicGene41325 [Symbiodinium microadriaticum]
MAFEEEVCPDDVETLVLPAGARRTAQVALADTQEMSQEGTLSDVAWADYEELYGKWKSGAIDDSAVVLAGGRCTSDFDFNFHYYLAPTSPAPGLTES